MNGTGLAGAVSRTGTILAIGLILYALVSGWSLERWVLGGGQGERELYVKLPLEQPRFHWYFSDEAALLRGSLEIAVHGASGRDTKLTVFSQGRMMPGWSPISRDERGIYFGFIGGAGSWTEPGDSVVITLSVPEDLEGIGAYRRGTLPRGRYQAVVSYGHLTGHPDFGLLNRGREPMAILSCWRSQWPLDITEERGWRGGVVDEGPQPGNTWLGRVVKVASPRRGTDGFRCVE